MSLLPPILSIFVLIHLTLCWHQCTEFSVQQYLCNYTHYWNNRSCSGQPTPNCLYDTAQSLCICKYLSPCWGDNPGINSYRLLQLNYSISMQLNNDNKKGIFSVSNLTTSYLQDVTTYLNSSLIPTGVDATYATWCNGPVDNYYYSFVIGQVLFNTTTNFTFDHNCDSLDLNVQLLGQPIYNYYTNAFYLYEYKGTYYIDYNYYINGYRDVYSSYGSMLVPETNSLSYSNGNFTCLSFNSIPDPPTFKEIRNGTGSQNETIAIPPNITNYIHQYYHRLYLNDASFAFQHHIVFYNQHSYINETNYFTYDDSCTSKTIYDNDSLSYLTNEFCCVEWQIAGIVSTTSGPTTVSPTSSSTTVSPTSPTTTSNPITTVETSQSTTLTTPTVHPSSNTCPNGWYQSPLASFSIWIVAVYALLSRSEKL